MFYSRLLRILTYNMGDGNIEVVKDFNMKIIYFYQILISYINTCYSVTAYRFTYLHTTINKLSTRLPLVYITYVPIIYYIIIMFYNRSYKLLKICSYYYTINYYNTIKVSSSIFFQTKCTFCHSVF